MRRRSRQLAHWEFWQAVCVPQAAAVIALAMIPALEFTGWPWASLVLATPVAVWGAWPLHRAA